MSSGDVVEENVFVEENLGDKEDSESSKKRKRKDDSQKKKKKKKKKTPKVEEQISQKDWDEKKLAKLLSDFLQRRVPEERIQTTTGTPNVFREGVSNSLPIHLSDLFQEKFQKEVTSVSSDDKPGHPKVLVICSSALRCVEILKDCKELHQKVPVGKMFAKHLKKEDQENFLKSKVSHILIGTPNRLSALISSKSLSLDRVEFVIFDSWKNPKTFSIFEVREVASDLSSLILFHFLDTKTQFSFL